MALVTLLDAKNKVIQDLDLDHESFITDAELADYFWDATRDVAATLLKMGYEDVYYLSKDTINLVSGTGEYSLPTNIYGNKILRVVYENGNRMYTVRRLRGKYIYENFHTIRYAPMGIPEYKYILLNTDTTTGYKMSLVPKAQETLTAGLTVWYIREPEKAVDDTDLLDVPEEFIQYVYSFVKVQCLKKDVGNPLASLEIETMQLLKKDMIDTLTDQTMDGDNEIPNDLNHYEESI